MSSARWKSPHYDGFLKRPLEAIARQLKRDLERNERKNSDITDDTAHALKSAAGELGRCGISTGDLNSKKEDGVTTQRVTIFYHCIGAFDVPERRKIPESDILKETRKGAAFNYTPAQIA